MSFKFLDNQGCTYSVQRQLVEPATNIWSLPLKLIFKVLVLKKHVYFIYIFLEFIRN